MKKLFLLIPVLVLSLTIKADPIPVSPGTNAIQTAIASASANAVLELSSGTYTEAGNFAISKSITIQAAAGATPVIAMKSYIRIEGENTQVTITGVKFDGALNTATDHCIRSYDEKAGKTLTLDKCEFTNYPNYVIYAHRGDRCMEAMTIRNCYFHNNAKYAIFIGYDSSHGTNQACNSLTVENSTFADCPNEYSMIYFTGPDDADAALVVNHCTFYKYNSDAIQWLKSSNVTITNSIFALPSSLYCYAVRCAGGTIDHCLNYNSSRGYSVASTNDITGNPYFVNTNADNYDFTPASISNARNAGTDNKNLGDLRWNSDDSAHPTTINITAGTGVIKAAVEAAWSGDEIVLATGTYNESARITLDKNITIKAAASATPTVVPVKDFAISNGKDVTLQGIKFDCTSLDASRLIYAADNAANNLTVDGCEFCNIGSNIAIYAGSSAHFDACVINDSYFHNGTNSAICFSKTSKEYNACDDLSITNSTFANFSGFNEAVIAFYNRNETTNSPASDDAKLTIDHCTFYNFVKTNLSSTYGFVDSRKSGNVVISNSIFAHPDADTKPYATYCYGGTVNNCLIYNTKGHRTDNMTINNSISSDPLFTDAANGDYSYAGNYVTGNVSPARNAGTDGSDLGDPRWYTPATYPETDFAAPDYVFTASKAKLTGSIVYETGGPDDPYIRYNRTETPGQAEWVIKATRACYVQAIVNMVDNKWNASADADKFQNHKHIFTVELFNSNGNSIGSVTEGPWTEDGYGGSDWYGDVTLPGYIFIENPGVYIVKLYNTRNNSRCGVGSVTVTYMGGDVQTITNTADFETDIDDAWFTSNGTRADGKISFSGDAVASEWVRWNVTVANSDYYDITLNSDVESGHIYSVTFYDGETQVARAAESDWHNTTGAIDLGRIFLPAGNYVMEIKNSVSSNSNAKIVSVEAVAFVAPTIALPNTLPAASAITSELAYEDGGELYFTPSNKKGYILDQWAKWKVSVASAGTFLFTMNVTSTNVQTYQISILDADNNVLEQYYNDPDGSGDKTIKHYFNLAAGNYFVMVQNKTNHSDGHIVSLVASQPSIVTLDEAAETDAVIMDNNRTEDPIDVQIIRTITPGMYNTFCLPFDLSLDEFKGIFGEDAVLKEMESAELEGDFVLNLNFRDATSVYRCKPYLIMTSSNIVNPAFADVTIKADEEDKYVTTGTNADFISTLIATELDADPDNLFLAADNKIYFPQNNPMPINGFRAYFHVHNVPAGAIKRARIIEQGNVVTEVDLVNGELQCTDKQVHKTIEDGQLLIIRDGIRYNALGNKIK